MAAGLPDRFGRYVVSGLVGRGATSTVYRAEDERTGRIVALKVIPAKWAGEAERRRLRREADVARELRHPGIVRVHGSGSDHDQVWIAMDLVNGTTLAHLATEQPIEWRTAAAIARDVAEALGYAHDRGVLHRDVKPSNILVDRDGRTRLSDFGCARRCETGSVHTKGGATLGTPDFMAPEQARGRLTELNASSDVWSLGAVLFLLLAGRPPFVEDGVAKLITAIVLNDPPKLRAVAPRVREELAAIVDGCLQKEPALRYQDGAAVCEDLRRVLKGADPKHALPAEPALWRSRWVRLGLAGMVAVGILGVTFSLALRPRGDVPPPPPAPEARGESLAERAWSMRAADPAAAARLMQQALGEDPGRADWRVRWGLLLWANGRGAAARSEWKAVPSNSPAAPAARLYTGLSQLLPDSGGPNRLQGQGALRAAAIDTGNIGLLANGATAILARNYPGARAQLLSAEGWVAALLRAEVELQPGGDAGVAVRELTVVLAQGVPFAWVFVKRADARSRLGDLAGALADLDRAVTLDPANGPAFLARGLLRMQLGDRAAAAQDFGAAERLCTQAADKQQAKRLKEQCGG